MSKGSAPASPDPYASANAQYTYGTAAADYNAALNRVNTSGPSGSTNYQITGYDPQTGAPIYSQNTTLSPQQQQLYDQSTGLKSGQLTEAQKLLGGVAGTDATAPTTAPIQSHVSADPLSYVSTANVPQIADVSDLYQKSFDTALAGQKAAIDPSMNAEKEQLDSSLRNSGAHPGDPAYDNAMAQLDARQANANAQAAGAATTAATGVQSTNYGESANTNQQLFGQSLQLPAAENQIQQQGFNQNVTNAELANNSGSAALSQWATKLGVPISELNSILTGSSPAMPAAVSPGQATTSTPDIMSAFTNQYNGQLANYNAGVASSNAAIGDATTLGALAYLALP